MEIIREIQQKLARNLIIRQLVPADAQMGIPQIILKAGKICLKYHPHVVEICNNSVLFGYPQVTFTVCYPSTELVYYSNLAYEDNAEDCNQKREISLEQYTNYINGVSELASLYSVTLQSPASEASVRICQKKFGAFVTEMNIDDLYKG